VEALDTSLVVVAVTFGALLLSAIAGYGGSLVLVPVLAVVLGPKEGIALAALLLAGNNVAKVVAYRHTLALREGWPLVLTSVVGVVAGSAVLIAAPEHLVIGGIVAMTVASLLLELAGDRLRLAKRRSAVPMLAASSVMSGTTGSSGPLKGLAIRHLGLPRLEHVGLASVVSLAADAVKSGLFAQAGLLPSISPWVLLAALPMMPLAAWTGLRINRRISEESFRWVFWGVVGGYSLRLAGAWF
jgi:uncharacterized protein